MEYSRNIPALTMTELPERESQPHCDNISAAAGTTTTITTSDSASDREEANIMNSTSSDTTFKQALDQLHTATMTIDADSHITYANKAALALLRKHEATIVQKFPGFSANRDAVLGACIDGFYADRAEQRRILAGSIEQPWSTDIKFDHLTLSLVVSAITDAEGNLLGNILEWSDVTHSRAQADLAAHLQQAIDISGNASMGVDRDLNIYYVNNAAMALIENNQAAFASKWRGFRATREFVIGSCIDNFYDDPSLPRNLLGDIKNLPARVDVQLGDATFSVRINGLLNKQGEHTGCSLEWKDVTEQRMAILRYQALTSALRDMRTSMMMAEPTGTIVHMNPAMQAMMEHRESQMREGLPGFRVDKVVGSTFDFLHTDASIPRNILTNPDYLPCSWELKVGSAEFSVSAVALKNSEGQHLGAAIEWIDTTDENDYQQQLDQLIRAAAKGDLDGRIQTTKYSGSMAELGASINELMDAVVSPVNAAIYVAERLAEGDLCNKIDGDYSGQFKALSNAINSSLSNLHGMVGGIREASTNVFSAAREIAQGNNDLSYRTEAQASSLEETASAMEQLTTTVQQNADNAAEATKLANHVMDRASNGGAVVADAVTAMKDIKTSSNKIADIISVIDEIAFQTNLLALNAAVEAARAGEQGRGFAVVAAEVRNLAGRSSAAAKEIKGLIKDSVEAVGNGTRLVDDTGRTFATLVESVAEVVTMITDISRASSEQTMGIREVSQAISQMDEMTQQNAALVEEASASSKAMEDQVQQLLDQVGFFKIEEQREFAPLVARPAPRMAVVPRGRNAVARAESEWQDF